VDSGGAKTFAAGTIGTGLLIGGGAVLVPAICIGGLNTIGFGAGGVVGGVFSLIYLISQECSETHNRFVGNLRSIGRLGRNDGRCFFGIAVYGCNDGSCNGFICNVWPRTHCNWCSRSSLSKLEKVIYLMMVRSFKSLQKSHS
jgi:hypothetical protein